MRRKLIHCSYVIVSLLLVYLLKSINPPALDYSIHYSTELQCIDYNLSGITYNPDSGNFFVISNGPEIIVEITPTGKCLRQYPLTGYEDTEDLFYIGDNRMLLVQERQGTVDLLDFSSSRLAHMQSLALRVVVKPNKGLEGVSYNSGSKSIFVVTEQPGKLFKLSGWEPMKGFSGPEPVTTFWSSYLLGDFSSVTDTGHSLILLSDVSSRLLELDYDGSVKASLNLKPRAFGESRVPQAEGVAMDNDENIYVVSEPNLLYVYKKNQLN